MTNVRKRLRGQGLLEYIALTALVAIVCITTVKALGNRVKTQVGRVQSSFDRAMRTGPAPSRGAAEARDDDGDSHESTPRASTPRWPAGVPRPW